MFADYNLAEDETSSMKLIFKVKVYLIPNKFQNLRDVNNNIYESLTTTKRYIVQSNVGEVIFQSFIEHWVNNAIPVFDTDNISEFEELSNEFGRMKDLIQLFKYYNPRYEFSLLLKNNQKYQKEIKQKTNFLKSRKIKYNQLTNRLIQLNKNHFYCYGLFGSNINDFENLELDKIMNSKFEEEALNSIDNYESQKVKNGNFAFIIDESAKTAGLSKLLRSKRKTVIPKSIFHQNQEFIIIKILENAFEFSRDIDSVSFEPNSKVEIIEKNAFACSSIKSICFPSSLIKIEDQAFYCCHYLKTVTFPINSHIEFIGNEAFVESNIESISICSHELAIGPNAFDSCNSLKNAEFNQLHLISEQAFADFSIEKITIPSNIVDLKPGCFFNAYFFKEIELFSDNKVQNIKYMRNDFIVGKSDTMSDVFDVLLYAKKDIKVANIKQLVNIRFMIVISLRESFSQRTRN